MRSVLDWLSGWQRGRRAPVQQAAHLSFDKYSLLVDGRRRVVRAGALHYFRLPSQDLWQDRLLKIKRAGYNTVDLYFNWAYHSPSKGVWDFDGIRDVDRLLALCAEMGLYVIARPGPYICAEVDGGGHPAWLLAEDDVPLRCLRNGGYVDSPTYRAYVRAWYEQIVPRIVRCPSLILFQIENEYANVERDAAYMVFLRDLARELGVSAPIIHNDLWKKGYWADVVDIYGVDDYAVTSFQDDWRGKPAHLAGLDGLAAVKEAYGKTSPLAVLELQGGWFDPWTGLGYDEIRRRLGRENMDLATWTTLAQGATIYSHYMFAGGVNWDHLGAPCVNASYDFAAPIHDWGGVSDRYNAAKAIAMLVGAFEDVFAESDPATDVGASDAGLLYTARAHGEARIAFLRNLSGSARSTALTTGAVQTQPVAIAPWSMRAVLLNAPFVNARLTATCGVFTALHHENQHLLAFYGPGRVQYALPDSHRLLRNDLGATSDGRTVTIDYDGKGWKDVVFTSAQHRYRSVFAPSADEMWLNGDYLVVGASYSGEGRMKGGVVDLPRYEMRFQTTDPKGQTVRVYSVGHLNRAEINDEMIFAAYDSIAGYLRFEAPPPPAVNLPALGPWRVKAALETGTPHPTTEWRTVDQGATLEMDRLGIYKGLAWYRAAYAGVMKGIGLAIRHNAAVYLNGRFVAKLDNYQPESTDGGAESAQVAPETIALPETLQASGENVLTILVQSLGHNKGFLENARYPRGILSATADRDLSWSVHAGLADEEAMPRPDLDDAGWAEAANLGEALPDDDLLWARTRFTLDLPAHAYAPIGLYLAGAADIAHIYLNGVLIARDWSVSPQRTFYLPEGVLDPHGENVLCLLFWRRGAKPAAGTVELRAFTVEANNYINVL